MAHLVKRILVGYDGSKESHKALEMAKMIARLDGETEVNLLSVIKFQMPYQMYAAPRLLDQDNLVNKLEEKANEVLDGIKKEWCLPNPIYSHVIEGNPVEEILTFAKSNEIDLIVIGNRGLGSVKEFLLGSVSHHVVQRAHCPVLIAK